MRTALLLLPMVLAGCWPYIAVPPTADELNGVDPGNDPTSDGNGNGNGDEWTSACADGPNSLGVWPKHPIGKAGVDTRASNYTFDAGVGPVLTKALTANNAKAVDLEIQDAVVTAVAGSGASTTLWIADKKGTIVVFKLPVDGAVEPGDTVRVHALEVLNYGGVPEITDGTVTVTGSGEKVWVEDVMDGSNLFYDDLPEVLVEVWGELVTKPEACGGGFDCFDLDHGSSKPITFRTPTGSASRYDCVHVIAPLDGFEGDTELTIAEESWFQTY